MPLVDRRSCNGRQVIEMIELFGASATAKATADEGHLLSRGAARIWPHGTN